MLCFFVERNCMVFLRNGESCSFHKSVRHSRERIPSKATFKASKEKIKSTFKAVKHSSTSKFQKATYYNKGVHKSDPIWRKYSIKLWIFQSRQIIVPTQPIGNNLFSQYSESYAQHERNRKTSLPQKFRTLWGERRLMTRSTRPNTYSTEVILIWKDIHSEV